MIESAVAVAMLMKPLPSPSAALAGVQGPALSGHFSKGMCAGEVPS